MEELSVIRESIYGCTECGLMRITGALVFSKTLGKYVCTACFPREELEEVKRKVAEGKMVLPDFVSLNI